MLSFMQIFEQLVNEIYFHWVTIIVVLHVGLSFLTSLHILLYKENERTSLAWIGLAILSPVVGTAFYWFFGINRIKREARKKHPLTLEQNLHRQDKKKKENQRLLFARARSLKN